MVTVRRVSKPLGKSIFSVEKSRSSLSASRKISSAAIASGPEASEDISDLLLDSHASIHSSCFYSEIYEINRFIRSRFFRSCEFFDRVHRSYSSIAQLDRLLSLTIPQKLYGSAVATSTSPVPGGSTRFVAVMCLTPVPGVSFAVAPTEFQDPMNLRLFLHCHTIFDLIAFFHRRNHMLLLDSSPLISDIDATFVVLPEASFVADIWLTLKTLLISVYGYSPRPSEICSASCIWRRFITLVCLWSLLFFCHHPVPGHLSIHNDVVVLSYLENIYSRRQGEFWFEKYKRNLYFGIVRRWLAFWTDNRVLSLTKSDLQLSLSECIKDTLILINYLCYLTSFCLFLKTYDGFFVALRMLYGAQTVTKLLCVSLVSKIIRDGLHELLRLIQQTDNSFEHWFFLLASHSSYNSKHGEFWLLVLQDAYVLCVPEEHFYSSHQFCSHNYNLSLSSTSRVMQKLQEIWTKTRLFLSLLQSHILVLSTSAGTSTALRVVGIHWFSVGFLYGSLPRPPEDHHQAFHRFHYTAGFCYGLLTLLRILSSVFRVFLPQWSQDFVLFGRIRVAISRCFSTMLAILFGSLPRPPELFVQLVPLLSFFCCFFFFMSKMKDHLEGEY